MWDFGDNTIGFINDSVTRQYAFDGKYTVTLQAYSKGGYKYDMVTQEIICSHRYLDRIEVIGNLNADELLFQIDNAFQVYTGNAASGVYTDQNPYTYTSDSWLKIPPFAGKLNLKGVINNVPFNTSYIKGEYEINSIDDNPKIVETNDYTLKMYWKIRSFN